MEQIIKRYTVVFLTVLFVFTPFVLSGCDKIINTSGGEVNFENTVTPYAFAVAMTYYGSTWENDSDRVNADFLWQATAWYAAYNYRTSDGFEVIISEDEAKNFQSVVNPKGGYINLPDEWLANDYTTVTEKDGAVTYGFPDYKNMIDDFLGENMEISVKADFPDVSITIIWHYDDGSVTSDEYKLSFEKNNGKYVITSVTLPDKEHTPDDTVSDETPAPDETGGDTDVGELTGGINFTYEDIYNANLLSNIFLIYPSVSGVYTDNTGYEYSVQLFEYDAYPVYYRFENDGFSGWYNGYNMFYNEETHRINAIPLFDGENGLNSYISDYLNFTEFTYLDETEEDIVVQSYYTEGYGRNTITLDRGTLAIKKIEYDSDENYSYTITFDYNSINPDTEYLDGWKDELRKVTYVTESNDGHKSVITESFEVPGNWEVLIAYIYYGDAYGYYAYLDSGYTQKYAYPGDGIDYTVYVTDSKE